MNPPRQSIELWLERAPAVQDPLQVDLLSEVERLASERFAKEHLRARYVCARVLLRRALASYTGIEPDHLAFERDSLGRPALKNDPQVDFNLSYSGHLVALGMTRGSRIGVDIEVINPAYDFQNVLTRVATPHERSQFATMADDEAESRFYALWVLKEAWSKAVGKGLQMPFNKVILSPVDSGLQCDLEAVGDDPANWWFSLWPVGDEAQLAIALRNSGEPPQIKLESGDQALDLRAGTSRVVAVPKL